jgi:hypothetical protein
VAKPIFKKKRESNSGWNKQSTTTGEICNNNMDQENISLDSSGRDVFDIFADHRQCQEDDANVAAAQAEACAKEPYSSCSTTSPVMIEATLLIDDALKIYDERDRRFTELYKYMPT